MEMKILTKRFGLINPLSIDDYIKHNGYEVLRKAVSMDKEKIIKEISLSRLSGRGGAGFSTAFKLKSLASETGDKYIICNADEGEPGNFKDRHLIENDPHQIIEGMIISAYVTGATKGFIYVRGEYINSQNILKQTIKDANQKGFLGTNILNENFDFDITVRSGAGSYVCGEEFALIESLEGKPGRTRVKPPFPTTKGVYNKPTLINNVETFTNLPFILNIGGEEYAKIGNNKSTGTKLISLSGNVKNKGLFEVPYGTTIKDVIYKLGNGIIDDNQLKMVQLGGASGVVIPPHLLNMEIDNEAFDGFSKIGAGAIIVIDERFDLFKILHKTMKFFEHESCGKCTPCRDGHIQLVILIKKFIDYKATKEDFESLKSLAQVMKETSLCGLGQSSPTSIMSTIKYFYKDYTRRIVESNKEEEEN